MAIANERMGQYLRELMNFLAQRQEADKTEVFAHLERVLQPNGDELAPEADGGPHWLNRVNWSSVILTRGTEWLSQDGGGKWSITPKGAAALAQYPDPVSFRDAAEAIYDDWRKSRPKRRAWLLRGSSVTGVNVVPNWLTDGFCSVAGSQLPPIEQGIEPADQRAVVDEAYSHLSHHELRAKSEEIVAFVTRMREGDLVLTTSEGQVYVGDIAGDWMHEASEGNRTNLRRSVQWRNPDASIDFSDLPAPLPARLQTGRTLIDLTADVELIDQLGEPTDAALVDAVETPPTRPHHEHLPQPSPEMADALFVKPEWLTEVRDVLDERRISGTCWVTSATPGRDGLARPRGGAAPRGSGDQRRVLAGRHLDHGRQLSQLHGRRVAFEHRRGLPEGLGGFQLALGVDDLGAPLALRLGLAAHGTAHGFGQLDVLDLDQRDLDAPWVGEVVDDLLELLVDLVALDQQVVELDLAEDAAQGGLGDLRRADQVVLDGDDRSDGLDDVEAPTAGTTTPVSCQSGTRCRPRLDPRHGPRGLPWRR